ncbi:MAG: hypothetical protein WBM00_05385, partial [Solirubrobacterales bacterium]
LLGAIQALFQLSYSPALRGAGVVPAALQGKDTRMGLGFHGRQLRPERVAETVAHALAARRPAAYPCSRLLVGSSRISSSGCLSSSGDTGAIPTDL